MAQIIPFERHIDAFDPETAQIMSQAFQAAWDSLSQSGRVEAAPFRAERTREAMAKRIIELATNGERDPDRLREAGLEASAAVQIAV